MAPLPARPLKTAHLPAARGLLGQLWGLPVRSDKPGITWGMRIEQEMTSGAIGSAFANAVKETEETAYADKAKVFATARPQFALRAGLVDPLKDRTYLTLLEIMATDPK